MELWAIILIMAFHWLADFVFQTSDQAKNKSNDSVALLKHVFTYTLTMICLFVFLLDSVQLIFIERIILLEQIFAITFISHFIIDYITSRINAKLWKQKQIHTFFVSIGFDQWLHFVQLMLVYKYIVLGT